jgi:Tfp pilus assembly protein PilF
MSLLMEALRKAEEAKRQAGEDGAHELSLNPLTPPESRPGSGAASPLPDLSLHIDSVDADLAAVSTQAPARRQAAAAAAPRPAAGSDREAAERTAARNVFSAKPAPRPRTGLWLFVALSAIAALGIGGYFWWQLQAVGSGSLARGVPAPPPAAPAQAPAMSATETARPAPEILPPAPPAIAKAAPEPPVKPAARPPKPPASVARTVPDSPVRLSRQQPRANQTLERAYDDLQAGRLDEAQRGYQQVLRSDAMNTDALLGLATLAARQGQTDQAQAFYQRALESDPNDPTAQAGLVNTRGQADPGLAESRLKTALAGQPDAAALHFALGNLYARQARWSEAQQSYFRAYGSEPDNADFIFNLAVSLDHLHQNRLAAQYYQMALNAPGAPNAAFDANQVKARVLELKP